MHLSSERHIPSHLCYGGADHKRALERSPEGEREKPQRLTCPEEGQSRRWPYQIAGADASQKRVHRSAPSPRDARLGRTALTLVAGVKCA
jgi:hypothetical protein